MGQPEWNSAKGCPTGTNQESATLAAYLNSHYKCLQSTYGIIKCRRAKSLQMRLKPHSPVRRMTATQSLAHSSSTMHKWKHWSVRVCEVDTNSLQDRTRPYGELYSLAVRERRSGRQRPQLRICHPIWLLAQDRAKVQKECCFKIHRQS